MPEEAPKKQGIGAEKLVNKPKENKLSELCLFLGGFAAKFEKD